MDFSLETRRLLLRPFTSIDANEYFKITRDVDIQKYVPYACFNSLDETLDAIQTCYAKADFKHDFYLIIEEKQLHKIIGSIIITQSRSSQDYDGCYFISKPYRNKGYMKEALQTFLRNMSVFDKNIIFCIEETNIPSLEMIKRIVGIKESKSQHCVPTASIKHFYYHFEKF